MNFVALKMLAGDRAKYLGLIFTIAFCTFLLENRRSKIPTSCACVAWTASSGR